MDTLLIIVKTLLFLMLLLPFWALIGNWFPVSIAAILAGGIWLDWHKLVSETPHRPM